MQHHINKCPSRDSNPGQRLTAAPFFTGKAAFFRKGLPQAPRISMLPHSGPMEKCIIYI